LEQSKYPFVAIRAIAHPALLFFGASLLASLSFTAIATPLTLLAALVTGYQSARRLGRRELLAGFLTPLVAAVLFQIAYFADVGRYITPEGVAGIAVLNVLIICLCGLIGGAVSLVQRKRAEHIARHKPVYSADPYARLFSSIVLAFYVAAFVLPPVPVAAAQPCDAEELTAETFIDCYDPDNDYSPDPEANIDTPKIRIPKEGMAALYEQYPDVPPEVLEQIAAACAANPSCDLATAVEEYRIMDSIRNGTAPTIIEQLILTGKGITYRIFNWNEPNDQRRIYMEGVWERTGGFATSIINGIGRALSNPGAAWDGIRTDAQRLGAGIMDLGYISALYQMDSREHYGNAYRKLFQGDLRQLGTIFNPFAGAKSFLDKRYPGGSGAFLQQAFSQKTGATILRTGASLFLSDRTIDAASRGHYLYALTRGPGEVVGTILSGKAIAKGVSLVPRVGKAIVDGARFLRGAGRNVSVISIPQTPSKEIILRNAISNHALTRFQLRGITKDMAYKAINVGTKYYDRDKKTFMYAIPNGMASGNSLRVAVSPETRKVVTVINDSHFNPNVTMKDGGKRFIPVK
jgi:hypothetical protein